MLLAIYSTLSQPEFTDPENLSDTSTASLGFSRTADESENLSDTFVVTREQILTDNPGVTDDFTTVQDFVSIPADGTGSVDTIETVQDFVQNLTDSSGISDETLTSQDYIHSFDEQEDLSDTTEITLSTGHFDPLDTTDTFTLDVVNQLDETVDLTDPMALSLSVVLTDGAGVVDSTGLGIGVELFDGEGVTDDHTATKMYERTFTDSGSILSDIGLDQSVTFTENDDFPNAIRFGGPLSFGTFVFGSGQTFTSDSFIATKEYTFTDNSEPRDSFKTVKAVLRLKITVEETELRWDLG